MVTTATRLQYNCDFRALPFEARSRVAVESQSRCNHIHCINLPFSRHQSFDRAVIGHSPLSAFNLFSLFSLSGCRFLNLELTPGKRRQCINSTVISASPENLSVPALIPGHCSVVNTH